MFVLQCISEKAKERYACMHVLPSREINENYALILHYLLHLTDYIYTFPTRSLDMGRVRPQAL